MILSVLAGLLSASLSYCDVPADTSRQDIERIYSRLSVGTAVPKEGLPGKFEYTGDGEKSGKYTAIFVSSKVPVIKYINYADDKYADYFLWGSKRIAVSHKLDPTSVRIYKVSAADPYVIFIGKAISASGSGVQVTYFIINKMTNDGKVDHTYERESRFGTINNLINVKEKEGLSYYKIVNGNKMNEFLLTVNRVEDNQQLIGGNVVLKYMLNDKFVILKNKLEISRK